jgi:ASC-1-like (ASCH) protein
MTYHTMKLHPAPFAMIASGRKTVELRLNDEKRRCISVGDVIEFTRTDREEKLSCRVVGLHPFPTFGELYSHFPLTAIGYAEEDVAHASPSDMDAYYTKEQQEKYGVLGIELEVLSNEYN